MRIAVFGRAGQVATELQRQAPGGVTLDMIGRDAADLARPTTVLEALRARDVDAIINAAAYTAVDRAETEPGLASAINGASVGTMAEHAAARGIPFVHISTDYVFDGTGEAPWRPGDPTGPLGVYGQSKLAGEALTLNAGGIHAIIRTSWVVSAHGSNFVKTMLRLGAERDALRVVADQVGGPTPAADLARACLAAAQGLADPGKSGTYHFAGAPDVSWAGFARQIFTQTGIACTVEDIPSSDYPTPAARPKNSRLDCALFETVFDMPRPDWRAGLDDILKELGAVRHG